MLHCSPQASLPQGMLVTWYARRQPTAKSFSRDYPGVARNLSGHERDIRNDSNMFAESLQNPDIGSSSPPLPRSPFSYRRRLSSLDLLGSGAITYLVHLPWNVAWQDGGMIPACAWAFALPTDSMRARQVNRQVYMASLSGSEVI